MADKKQKVRTRKITIGALVDSADKDRRKPQHSYEFSNERKFYNK